MWQTHAIVYYAAIKRNKVLTGATTWMNPENLKLSERRQTQKDLHEISRLGKFIKTEVDQRLLGGGEERGKRRIITSWLQTLWSDEKVWETDSDDACTTL